LRVLPGNNQNWNAKYLTISFPVIFEAVFLFQATLLYIGQPQGFAPTVEMAEKRRATTRDCHRNENTVKLTSYFEATPDLLLSLMRTELRKPYPLRCISPAIRLRACLESRDRSEKA